MKRILAAALCAATVSSFGLASAEHDSRTVDGAILLPTTRTVESPVVAAGILSRQARCAYLLAQEATGNGSEANGLFGHVVELTPDEGTGEYTFTANADEGDLSVVFYSSLGNCESTVAPVNTGTSDQPGNEAGPIPFGSTHAILVVEGAADVAFAFTAIAPQH